MTDPLSRRTPTNTSVVAVLYVSVATFIFIMWVWSADTPTTAINSDPRSKLSDLIYGRAHNPYVQRVLVPFVTRTLYSALPESLWRSLTEPLRTLPKTQKEMQRLGWEQEFFPQYLIALLTAYLLFLPFPFLARRLWSLLYQTDERTSMLAGMAPLLVAPTFFPTGPHYIYDLPALTLFTAGLVLLLERKWFWYYPLLVVGCLNKETMVLLGFAFFFSYRKHYTGFSLIVHIAAHVVLFVAVKLTIVQTFTANPGPTLDFHLYGNLHRILMGYTWSELLIAGATVFLVLHDLRAKPPALLRLALLVVPFGFLLLFFGVLPELRAVYELVPILTFMVLHTIRFGFFKQPYAVRPLS